MFAGDRLLISDTHRTSESAEYPLEIKPKPWPLVNLSKSNIIVVRKWGFLGKKELWFY